MTGKAIKAATWDGWLKLGAIVTATGVLVGFYFTSNSFQATTKANEISREAQITDRFTKAVQALDNNQGLYSRIGGIYSLERLSIDSTEVRDTAMAVLATFINGRAHTDDIANCDIHAPIADDVAAAMTVISRRSFKLAQPIYINSVCFPNFGFKNSNLEDVLFINSNLALTGIKGGRLDSESFDNNHMEGALFQDIDLTGVKFVDNYLNGADFRGTNLTNARFLGSQLDEANFLDANLSHACFAVSNLPGTLFDLIDHSHPAKNMNTALFIKDKTNDKTRWPLGFTPPPSIVDTRGSEELC